MSTDNIKDKEVRSDSKSTKKEGNVIVKKDLKKDNINTKKARKKKLDDVLNKVDSSRAIALERRVRTTNKSLKGKKVKAINRGIEEKKLDQEIEMEESLSVATMILIIVACCVLGSIIGYMLYRIAMNSGNALLVIPYFFK